MGPEPKVLTPGCALSILAADLSLCLPRVILGEFRAETEGGVKNLKGGLMVICFNQKVDLEEFDLLSF